jgi:hypothetical protein
MIIEVWARPEVVPKATAERIERRKREMGLFTGNNN